MAKAFSIQILALLKRHQLNRAYEVPMLKLTKEQCQEYAEKQGLPFEAEEDIPEFDFVCHEGAVIKTSGTCDGYLTQSQCESLPNYQYNANWNSGQEPPGCFVKAGKHYYNTNLESTRECGTAESNCMCKQVLWTPYKATGICLKNDFPEDIDTTETYSYESFKQRLHVPSVSVKR